MWSERRRTLVSTLLKALIPPVFRPFVRKVRTGALVASGLFLYLVLVFWLAFEVRLLWPRRSGRDTGIG